MQTDIIVFTDDDGNEFEMDIIDCFEHEGQEYAVITDLAAYDEDNEETAEQEIYIMKIMNSGTDDEEFVPVDEAELEALIPIVEDRLIEVEE